MFNTPPDTLMPVVVFTLERIGDGDFARKVEFDAMATPEEISLRDANTGQLVQIEGVLLTRLEDHKAGIYPRSLFAVTERDQLLPLFRRTPEDDYIADVDIVVKDIQMPLYTSRR